MKSKKQNANTNRRPFHGFGERLKEAFGVNQQSLIAKRMNVKDATVHNYMKGRIPAAKILINISDSTGCSIHWLLTGEGEKYVSTRTNETDYLQDKVKQLEEGNRKLLQLFKEFQSKQKEAIQEMIDEIEMNQKENENL